MYAGHPVGHSMYPSLSHHTLASSLFSSIPFHYSSAMKSRTPQPLISDLHSTPSFALSSEY